MTYEDRTELRRLLMHYRLDLLRKVEERRRNFPFDVADHERIKMIDRMEYIDVVLGWLNEELREDCHQ